MARGGQVRKEGERHRKKQTRNSYPKKAPVPVWTPGRQKRGWRGGAGGAGLRQGHPAGSVHPLKVGRGRPTGGHPAEQGGGDPPEPTLVPTHETPAEGPAWTLQAVGGVLHVPARRAPWSRSL